MCMKCVLFSRPSAGEVQRWAESLEALLSNQCKNSHLCLTNLKCRSQHDEFLPISSIPLLLFYWSDGLTVFRHFLRSEFSEENLDFWLAVERFKRTRPSSKMAARGAKIYDQFISTAAARQVPVCLSSNCCCFLKSCLMLETTQNIDVPLIMMEMKDVCLALSQSVGRSC